MDDLRVAAAILAGGRGERLGNRNKALIEIGGRRMIDRVIAAIGDVDEMVLCAGPNGCPPNLNLRTIPDLPTDYGGPLAGVAAAVSALARHAPDLVLTLAVDTPFFPRDFVERALPILANNDVVVAAWNSQDYPTNALWRFSTLAALPAEVTAGTAPHSLKRLIAMRRSIGLDYASSRSENPFANLNTPADLAHFRMLAMGENPS